MNPALELAEAQRTRDCARALRVLITSPPMFREDGFKTIADMSRDQQHNLADKFCLLGACEQITKALALEQSTPVLWNGFRTIGWLCHTNAEARRRFGDCGACELIIASMRKNLAVDVQMNRNLADYACFAIACLANNNRDNKKRFQRAQAALEIQRCPASDMRTSALSRV